jgi:hypothetical protein
MATVSNTLKMFDQMTRPLQQVTQALNLTISSMDSLANSANADIKITNTLSAARGAIQNANAGLNQLVASQDNAANTQNRLNNEFNKGANASNGLISKVKGLAAAYFGFEAAKQGIKGTIGGAMGLQQQLFTLQGIMGNKEVGTAYFDNLQKKANESVFGFEDFAANARKYMQFTKNTDSLDKLANISERLTLMDPTQGLQGAGFALKEAMSGDFISLKERFGFGKADAEILKASTSMDDFISKFDTLLSKKGFTDSMLEQYNNSAAAQFDNLQSNFKTALSQAGNGALEILAPVITRINNTFSNGGFQSFFNNISIGLSTIVSIGLDVADVLTWIGNVVSDNWSIISPIVWGVVTAIAAYNIAVGILNITSAISKGIQLASAIATAIHTKTTLAKANADAAATASQWGLNAALLACPITWIIIGIIALIVIIYAAVGAINHFAGTSWSATGIIIGAFAVLGAFIWNTVVGVINAVIQFLWTRFVEPWIGIIEWVLNVFNGGFNSFGDAVANLIGQIISWFLSLGKVVTKIIDAIFGTDWTGGLSSIQDSVLSWGKNEKAITLERNAPTINSRIEYGQAWDSGYNFGENIASKFSMNNLLGDIDKATKQPIIPDLNAWNAAQGPGELSMSGLDKDSNKHLKNIDDKIDVSNEHLELLRDLAEQDSIQNFVTLSPTVQVKTGDIRETADFDMIISKIEAYMENELVNSAEGVYT